jgi:phosphoribosylaminoimidazolecarboxamide formyltransferase/IMP cyclohydrolase
MPTRRALLSVSDKSGLADFGRALVAQGFELISTGGTARALRDAGLPVRSVEEITGFPEMLDGRVKTLQPAIHGGLLARRDLPAHMADLAAHGIAPIDLIVVNLYPFEATAAKADVPLDELIEQIDIGGVALLRAAAKNHAFVTVISDPADYAGVLADLAGAGEVSAGRRAALAVKAFTHTAGYDAAIAATLSGRLTPDAALLPERIPLSLRKVSALRYGENPHQHAALYSTGGNLNVLGGRQMQGKELSYNNILDTDAAWRMASDFAEPAVAIIKHNNPAGLAIGETQAAAFSAALACDPVSAFGGVIAVNRPLSPATVQAMGDLFVEVIAAPGFEPAALTALAKRTNCRLLDMAPVPPAQDRLELRAVRAGILAQDRDTGEEFENWQVVSKRAPTAQEMTDLRFAWIAAKHTKSNAIVFVKGQATVGVGAGQMSRVDSVRIGGIKAGERARGSVIGSDAFFPFPDGVELAAQLGVTAAVEPGGSLRDADVIAAADAAGMALVFTGRRHFKH